MACIIYKDSFVIEPTQWGWRTSELWEP